MSEDLYDILGVAKTASQEEIKKAYRLLVKQHHPDVSYARETGNQPHFQRITDAYQTLSDPQKRAHYDLTYGFTSPHTFSFEKDKVFADILKKTPQTTKQKPSRSIKYTLTIGFLESVQGTRKILKLHNGQSIYINIPAGIEEGQVLRLKNQGLQQGQEHSDALVEINITPHAHFKRKGYDLLLNLPISLDESILGTTITLPTPCGHVALKIKPGTPNGTILRLSQKGIITATHKGDLLVTVLVSVPEKPDQDLITYMREWAKKNPHQLRQNLHM